MPELAGYPDYGHCSKCRVLPSENSGGWFRDPLGVRVRLEQERVGWDYAWPILEGAGRSATIIASVKMSRGSAPITPNTNRRQLTRSGTGRRRVFCRRWYLGLSARCRGSFWNGAMIVAERRLLPE